MSQQTLTLAYLNEDDRAYGLAGMMISLASLRAIDRVAEVSLDSEGPMVEFSHEYYFPGSPSISPKSTWDNQDQGIGGGTGGSTLYSRQAAAGADRGGFPAAPPGTGTAGDGR